MKKFTHILVFLMSMSETYAQAGYFNKRYDFYGYSEVMFNVIETDSGYLTFGGVNNSTWWLNRIGIMFIDSSGNELWRKDFGKNGYNYYAGSPGSLENIGSNGYIMFGSVEDTIDSGDAILYRFNNIGDTLWTKRYGDTANQQIGSQCKLTPDSGFILIGVNTTFDPDGDFWLIKTDSAGNVEWDTTYGGVEYEFGLGVDVCNDKGFILVGTTRSYGQDIGFTSDIYVIKVDSIGKVQWSGVYGGPYGDAVWNVEHTSDGGYIIGGGLTDSAPGGFPYSRPYLIKLDSTGIPEWEKTYGPVRFQTTLRMVRELPDGNFIACGHTTDSIGFHGMGLVLKVAANGDSIWYRTHEILSGNSSENFLYDIRPTSDNGFISAGWLKPSSPDTGGQDMWVVKMDSCGCLYAGCDSACQGLVSLNYELSIKNEGFRVFPNPAPGKFTIEITSAYPANKLAEVLIYDVFGRVVKKIETRSKIIEADITHCQAGVYLIQLRNENTFYNSRVIKH